MGQKVPSSGLTNVGDIEGCEREVGKMPDGRDGWRRRRWLETGL